MIDNEIEMIYKFGFDNKIKLFDDKFVEKNKNNCILIINNKQYELCEYYYNSEKKK